MVVTEADGDATSGYSLNMFQYGNESLTDARFAKKSSLFRQRLKFTDEPFISSDGDVYFALMFSMDNIDKPLVLEARDVDGNVYSVTKEVPEGGFKNGKYYFGEASLAWKKTVKPTVMGTGATPIRGCYSIEEDPVDLELGGNSEDYYFRLVNNQGGTITLDNVHASGSRHEDLYTPFISQIMVDDAQNISLVLTGSNSIECRTYWAFLIYGDLKLSCTGSEATLTVTTTSAECCGISGWNYRSDGDIGENFNDFYDEGELDVTNMLAAEGFTVMRGPRQVYDEDHDFIADSYSWTYTVRRI